MTQQQVIPCPNSACNSGTVSTQTTEPGYVWDPARKEMVPTMKVWTHTSSCPRCGGTGQVLTD